MRIDRERTKKLIVAFHFQFANQAGWRCEDCRASGLERIRRCGWLAFDQANRPVWARRTVALDSCPVSYITGESKALLEEFEAWKMFGGRDVFSLPARTAEAFCVLEKELRGETKSGEQ